MKYTVTSDRLAGCERGATVTETDMADGVNVAVLVAAGHLAAVPPVARKPAAINAVDAPRRSL